MLTGAVIFNGLDAAGRDAVAHEGQDLCQGQPVPGSTYHYHSLTSCIADPGTAHSNLLGYALDGFGSLAPAAPTAHNSPTPTSTSATATLTPSPGTARPSPCTTITPPRVPLHLGCFHGIAVKANYVAGTVKLITQQIVVIVRHNPRRSTRHLTQFHRLLHRTRSTHYQLPQQAHLLIGQLDIQRHQHLEIR